MNTVRISEKLHDKKVQRKEPKDVSVNDPTLFNCTDDAGEIIIGDHHVRVFFGDLGSLDPHGDADVRLLHSRGCRLHRLLSWRQFDLAVETHRQFVVYVGLRCV